LTTAFVPVSTCTILAPATFTYYAPTTPTNILTHPVSQSNQFPKTSTTPFEGSASAFTSDAFSIFLILLITQLVQL
jgi:hypothetical protein